MTPEDVLSRPARVLTQAQRESYFANGYVCVEGLIPTATVARLNEVTEAFIDRSRAEAESGAGLALIPEFLSEPGVTTGTLRYVLPDWTTSPVDVIAVWPSNAPKDGLVKRFVAFLGDPTDSGQIAGGRL